ncbi:hypothetical protein [uncultured Corynebacterium sp.]|uniref:hypothetical protein n=1 Tax=uncultured Corynebacterium sp. TaxID=159447 RepID=UPI002636701C|nr:hypothetical protein [uncultured Corynebacterium sp.]
MNIMLSERADATSPSRSPTARADDGGDAAEQEFPDVLNTELTPDGDVLTEHVLAHDHANEQPFTRIREPFDIPDEVGEIAVEGRDRANGCGGGTVTVPVPR